MLSGFELYPRWVPLILVDLFFPSSDQNHNLIKSSKFHLVKY